MRIFASLFILVLLAFGLWPYYGVYQLDHAIAQQDPAALAALVDLPAIRANYKRRVTTEVKNAVPDTAPDTHGVMSWIGQNLERLGDAALDQVITPAWVQTTLRDAITKTTGQTPAYLMAGIEFAFFESYNRFLLRIGDLGQRPTHVRLTLIGTEWKITDIITSGALD